MCWQVLGRIPWYCHRSFLWCWADPVLIGVGKDPVALHIDLIRPEIWPKLITGIWPKLITGKLLKLCQWF